MSTDQINIRPGVGMLGLFPHMKYQPWYALGELVDNAIQSNTANLVKLKENNPDHQLKIRIQIERLDGGSITVSDNAAGISAADWERAFQVAEPPVDATGLSQFGVGMKAACCWFAQKWVLRSAALGSGVMRAVSFDVPQIVASRDDTLEVVTETLPETEHFTVIEMTNLNRAIQGRTLGKIRTYLGGIYREFLRDGSLVLTVNGNRVTYDDPPVLRARRYNDQEGDEHLWRQNVDIALESGRRVRGFVAIRETGDARQAGLALIYRKKVVTGSGEEVYKPADIFKGGNSFEAQRIFGELNMDDFEVTYTKDALVWHDEEDEFIKRLRGELSMEPWPLIKQAREYRKRAPEVPVGRQAQRILESIEDAFKAASESEGSTESTDVADAASDKTKESDLLPHTGAYKMVAGSVEPSPSGVGESVGRTFNVTLRQSAWVVDLRLVSDPAVTRWLTVGLEGRQKNELSLTVNQAHPFMRAWCEVPGQELEPVWRVAVAIGLGQELARAGGAQMPGLVTENINDILRNVMSRKS